MRRKTRNITTPAVHLHGTLIRASRGNWTPLVVEIIAKYAKKGKPIILDDMLRELAGETHHVFQPRALMEEVREINPDAQFVSGIFRQTHNASQVRTRLRDDMGLAKKKKKPVPKKKAPEELSEKERRKLYNETAAALFGRLRRTIDGRKYSFPADHVKFLKAESPERIVNALLITLQRARRLKSAAIKGKLTLKMLEVARKQKTFNPNEQWRIVDWRIVRARRNR